MLFATEEYTLMVLSPLHANLFSFFLTLRNKFYEVHLDNIYMSTKYAYLSYTYQNCVKVKGIYKARGCSIPIELFKTKFHDKKVADQAW